MISTRTPWWAAAALSLSLALTAGCGTTEEPMSSPTSSPAVAPPATPPPSAPTETKPEPAPTPTPTKEAPPATKEEPPKIEAPKIEAPKIEAPKLETPKIEAPKEAPKAASAVKLTDEEVAELKKLPAGDRDLALKQAVCPVSGEHLGTPDMGAPVKVTAEGKTFFICCKGCQKEVNEHPKDVLAKLPK